MDNPYQAPAELSKDAVKPDTPEAAWQHRMLVGVVLTLISAAVTVVVSFLTPESIYPASEELTSVSRIIRIGAGAGMMCGWLLIMVCACALLIRALLRK